MNGRLWPHVPWGVSLLSLVVSGCLSPYYADRGALYGGLTGAGAGAIIGDAVGNTGAGTVIGAGLGAMTGATVGNALDEVKAQNREEIARQLGRSVSPGAVSLDAVVAMTRAGVDERLIVRQIEYNGIQAPVTPANIIYLHEQGVSNQVIQTLQAPGPLQQAVLPPRPPVIIEEYHYGPPWRRPYPSYGW